MTIPLGHGYYMVSGQDVEFVKNLAVVRRPDGYYVRYRTEAAFENSFQSIMYRACFFASQSGLKLLGFEKLQRYLEKR